MKLKVWTMYLCILVVQTFLLSEHLLLTKGVQMSEMHCTVAWGQKTTCGV